MGGHGGLNILPQKKWNVYNWDNRIKVEKDKRLAREAQELEEKQRQKSATQARIDRMKYNNKSSLQKEQVQKKQRSESESEERSRSRSRSLSKSKSKSSDGKPKSKLTKELKEMAKSKHINLFEEEEQQVKLKENLQAQMQQEQEFFKELPFDSTSKFMGNLSSQTPWYMKGRQQTEEKIKMTQQVQNQINQFGRERKFCQVIDINNQQKQRDEKLESNKTEKKEEKLKQKQKKQKSKQEKIQKLALKLKELLGSDVDSDDHTKHRKGKSQIKQNSKQYELLRQQKIQREKMEIQKEQRVINEVFQFNFQQK